MSIALAPRYTVKFTDDAKQDVGDLDGSIRNRLRKVLEEKVAVDPEGYGVPLSAPLANFWKHEFASHRVIYRIYESRKLVVICAVGKRREGDTSDVYKHFEPAVRAGKVAEQIRKVLKDLGK
jgi:mRNA-degrading endonuclease RelE of RelBE toxin-antitoxin system